MKLRVSAERKSVGMIPEKSALIFPSSGKLIVLFF